MAVSERHRRALDECRVAFVKDLEPDDVLDYLISDEILVPQDLEKIESMKMRKEKVRYLLDLIPRRGNRAISSFMKALADKDTGHYHLYEMINTKLEERDQSRCIAPSLGPGPPVNDQSRYAAPSLEPRQPVKCTDPPKDYTDAFPARQSHHTQSATPGHDIPEFARDQPKSPNKMLTDKLLSQLASNLGKEWEELAVKLGLTPSDIYKCKMESQYNLWGQIHAALIKWKNRKYRNATIGELVSKCRECDIGREVYEFLMNE